MNLSWPVNIFYNIKPENSHLYPNWNEWLENFRPVNISQARVPVWLMAGDISSIVPGIQTHFQNYNKGKNNQVINLNKLQIYKSISLIW